jgi:hypothetical protein
MFYWKTGRLLGIIAGLRNRIRIIFGSWIRVRIRVKSIDRILGHQFYSLTKDSSLLLHAIHSPFYWRIKK